MDTTYKLESIPDLLEKAKTKIEEERGTYIKELECIHSYIREKQLMVADISEDGERITIYSTNIFAFMLELTNKLFEINELVELRTIKFQKDFEIQIIGRMFVKGYAFPKRGSVNLEDIISPAQPTRISFPERLGLSELDKNAYKILPPEYHLVKLYKRHYTLVDDSDDLWDDIIRLEKRIPIRKALIIGGGDMSLARNELLEFIRKTNGILIGSRAVVRKYTKGKPIFKNEGAIQWLSGVDWSSQLRSLNMTVKEHQSFVGNQIKYSVHSEGKRIGDFYIVKSLVPYYSHYYNVAHSSVVKRYLLMDMLSLRVVEKLTQDNMKQHIEQLFKLYCFIMHSDKDARLTDDMKNFPKWSGKYIDEDLKIKRDKFNKEQTTRRKVAHSYYPKKYLNDRGKLLTIG